MFTATSLLVCACLAQTLQPADYPRTIAPNLLGNGGMEEWSLGVPASTGGPIPPELWYPQGNTTNLFGQTGIEYTRVPITANFGSGEYVMACRAMAPGSFVAQSLEAFSEFHDEDMTFSVDLSTPFSQAVATIAIDDGLASTVKSEVVVNGVSTRLTVRHHVHPNATHLQFRVFPEQTLWIDNAQAIQGKFPEVRYRPRPNHEPGVMQVPLGGVQDWYRFHPDVPVPDGYEIADGSPVADPVSPFVGLPTPDLRDRFVRGAASVAAIGTTGGQDTADLKHTHSGTTGAGSSSWLILQNPIGPVLNAARNTHTHSFTTNSALNTPVSIVPRYVGLLKIVRVK